MAFTGSTGLMHLCHLVGAMLQDQERMSRTAGLRLAVAGAGALLGGILSSAGCGVLSLALQVQRCR